MITITKLSKNYGKKTLFDHISLKVHKGEKVGLIGPNGAGKSTLFYLILGEQEPANGSVTTRKGARIGYLAQEANFTSDHTVLEEIAEGDSAIRKINKERETLEAKGETANARYGEILHMLEVYGFFELEYKAKKVLAGLGFSETDFTRSITDMSGGWQMRVLLAKLLTCQYDILLLDEPTNYLDLVAALWFKDYLKAYNGTFIMISHDKAFLNEVTNYTLVLEEGKLTKVKGTYAQYQKIKNQMLKK